MKSGIFKKTKKRSLKKKVFYLSSFTLLSITLIMVISSVFFKSHDTVLAVDQNGTTLSAKKTQSLHWVRTFNWSLEKTTSLSLFDLFRGDTGTSNYTIVANKDGGTEQRWLDGEICVTNEGDMATENLRIVDELTMSPSKTVIASVEVDISMNPVLEPSESYCYPYQIDISGTPEPGTTYEDTANVTITDHSGHLGEPFGPSPSASGPFPSKPMLVHDIITVQDTKASPGI